MFRADLHIHSRFSRATSPRLTVPNLAAWAGAKGIHVLATGDFTHPAWRSELKEALALDENTGLYRLKKPLGREGMAREIPQLAGITFPSPSFILQAEISSIYKKNGRVRKVHSLVYMPDFDAADAFCQRLEAIGNLASDGRPILGLDVKDLLAMVLEFPGARMIPAHIWTPWFSLFGSKSGFDSLEECFEDLAPQIFAAETGLSSDPDMNRCWSHLDHLTMVSSSDAHSGENLAREATLFDGEASYQGIFDALQKKEGAARCLGTLEFFPEEGKYHLDGHRACGVVLEPEECMKLNNICPVCGKPLTVGVLHRVLALADRTAPPCPGKDFTSLVPLPEIMGEILRCGAKTKKVQERYPRLLERFGSETDILQSTPLGDLSDCWPELGEAVRRMREGRVVRHAGFDGQYGIIRLFEEAENKPGLLERVPPARRAPVPAQETPKSPSFAFTEAQQKAIAFGSGPLLVLAGPGSGKTRTLIGRMAHLLKNGVPPGEIVAVTFTRRAADEIRARLSAGFGNAAIPQADTLHALALAQWQGEKPVVLSEEGARKAFMAANPALDKKAAEKNFEALERARELQNIPADLQGMLDNYRQWKKARRLADYTDLPEAWLSMLRENPAAPRPWRHVLADEVQDLSPLQRSLIRALVPADGSGFFGIGDPDQSIYGFRGSDANIESSLRGFWPNLECLTLSESHRSADAVLGAGRKALHSRCACGELHSVTGASATLQWLIAPSAEREAEWIAERISRLIGGTSHEQADRQDAIAGCHLEPGSCSPGDIAVLCRLKALIPPIKKALERKGIPCIAPESEAFWKDSRVDMILAEAARRQKSREREEKQAALSDPLKFPLLAALAQDASRPTEEETPLCHVERHIWERGPQALPAAACECFDPLFEKSDAFARLCRAWKEHGGWDGLLQHVALRRELDLVRSRAEQVQIMTLHASKGLEFKAVFIPACEDGILPFKGMGSLTGAAPAEGDEAEEARILYVGITRAAEAVFLSSAQRRTLFGHALELPPSPLVPAEAFSEVRLARHTKVTLNQLRLC